MTAATAIVWGLVGCIVLLIVARDAPSAPWCRHCDGDGCDFCAHTGKHE